MVKRKKKKRLTLFGQIFFTVIALLTGILIGVLFTKTFLVKAEEKSVTADIQPQATFATDEMDHYEVAVIQTPQRTPEKDISEAVDSVAVSEVNMPLLGTVSYDEEIEPDYGVSIDPDPIEYTYTGDVLNPTIGKVYGPMGFETYYNLDMSGVVAIMRGLGFSEEDYPYWVRNDGAKMLGDYIMCAADLNNFQRGSTVPCSLGTCIVADTGEFVYNGSGVALDIAVTW